MSVISFLNQKGGSGKTTASVHCGYWLSQRKKKTVLLIDSDAQRSSSQWINGMETPYPCHVLDTPDDLLEQLPGIADRYEFVIVDAPGGLAELTRAILLRSDIAAIPVQPTGVDLRSAGDAVRLVKQAQSIRSGLPVAGIFLSRAVKGTNLKLEAIECLNATELLMNAVIHQKQVLADSSGQCCTVWDMGKTGAESATEYEALFTELLGLQQ